MFQDSQIGTTAPKRSSRGRKSATARRRRLESAAPKRSLRSKKAWAETQPLGERYTPLLSREAYTFSRMRIDGGGPRTRSAICFPGWIRT